MQFVSHRRILLSIALCAASIAWGQGTGRRGNATTPPATPAATPSTPVSEPAAAGRGGGRGGTTGASSGSEFF